MITVAAGFPSTVNPIVQNQKIPVFVDLDVENYNINIVEMKKALYPKTRAIMIAHTYGNPINLKEVTKFAKENNFYLIEDCCDAVGSTYDVKMVGTFGDTATVSFYPAHHMTMGEGGAIEINKLIYKRLIESFRVWGRDCYCEPGANNTCGKRFGYQMGSLPYGYDHKYIYSHIGYNLNITDMQAAIGVAQLKKLPNFIKRRKENFNSLNNHLKKYEKYLILTKATENSGKVGATISIATAPYSLVMVLSLISIPKMNVLVAQKKWEELNYLFKNVSILSLILFLLGFILLLFLLPLRSNFSKFNRFSDSISIIILYIAWFFQVPINLIAFYGRSFKKEPFVFISIIMNVISLLITILSFFLLRMLTIFFLVLLIRVLLGLFYFLSNYKVK